MRIAAVLLVLPLVLVGCGGGGASDRISKSQLSSFVLQPKDLGEAWSRFDVGRQVGADVHAGPRGSATRFGREGGWKARYRRTDATAATHGPLVVESRADAFEDDGGAAKDLHAYADEWKATAASAGATSVDYPKVSLGDEGRAVDVLQGTRRNGQRLIVVAWRRGNATASVTATGLAGRISLGDVLALARKQDARIARAD